MPQDTPEKKTDYVLVYDGEHGVRLAPSGVGRHLTLEERMGWAPREAWESEDLLVAAADEEAPDPPRRRRGGLLAGAAGLCVLAVSLGLTVRSPRLEPPANANAVTGLPTLHDAPAQVAAAPPGGDSATLRAPETAAAPLRLAQATVLASPAVSKTATLPRHVAAAGKPRHVELASNARPAPHHGSGRKERADCGLSHADAMVCGDTELAAADRRLGQALQAAVTSGASLEDLRAQQDAWRIQRDAAARTSHAAVVRAYERRIEELKTHTAAEPPY